MIYNHCCCYGNLLEVGNKLLMNTSPFVFDKEVLHARPEVKQYYTVPTCTENWNTWNNILWHHEQSVLVSRNSRLSRKIYNQHVDVQTLLLYWLFPTNYRFLRFASTWKHFSLLNKKFTVTCCPALSNIVISQN